MVGGAALKSLPGIGLLAGMGMGAFSGWNDAGNIVGKDADSLTTADKIEGAAYGAASALTLGLVDPKTIRDGTQAAAKWLLGDPQAEYAANKKAIQEQQQKTRDAGNKAIQSTINSAIAQSARLKRKAAQRGDDSLTDYEKFKIKSGEELENIGKDYRQ